MRAGSRRSALRHESPPMPVVLLPPRVRGDAYASLLAALEHAGRLHTTRLADPALATALERLSTWQARRLRATYADLERQQRYAAAIDFFETDLYGGADFAQRDADLARVVSAMKRMLPEAVIATIDEAMELNTLSQELDRALLARLPRRDGWPTVAEYCAAYREPTERPARERQIRLIGDIGAALDKFVRKPLIHAALVMMRQPARLAGLSTLHDFLERGFSAFQRMDGADLFLTTIEQRETALMSAIFDGASAPFPDPREA
jgi:hypothetical protein